MRRIVSGVFLLILVLFGSSLAQVRIREKISINPKPNLSQASSSTPVTHSLRFEAAWSGPADARLTIEHRFPFISIGGCVATSRSGTGSITHSIPLAPAGIYDLELGNIGQAMTTATIRVYLDDQLVRQETSTEGFIRLTYNTPYATGFRLTFPSPRQMLYEESMGANVQARYDCGTSSSWNPSTDPITLTIVSGIQYAQFWEITDPFFGPRVPRGTTVTTLNSTMISVAADGTLPDSAGAWVRVTAERNGIIQSDSTLIKPYFYSVQADPIQIESGGESILHIRTVDVNGNEHFRGSQGTLAQLRLADSVSRYGTLWYGYEGGEAFQVGDTLKDVEASFTVGASGIQLKFLANEQAPDDTTQVVIIVEKTGEGSSTEFIPLEVFPYPGRDSVKGVGKVSLIGRPSEFARFEIIVDPDTIRQTDTARVFVQAIDANGNDVQIEDGTLLDFSLEEGSQAAHLSTPDGQLTGIRYGNVKKGSEAVVKLVARPAPVPLPAIAVASIAGSNSVKSDLPSDSLTKVLIRVVKQIEVDKKGEMYAYIKRLLILFIQDHSPWSIWPDSIKGEANYNPKRSFALVVRDGLGRPLEGVRIKIATTFQQGTGGHGHANGDIALPQDQQGVFYSSGRKGNPLEHLTTATDGTSNVDTFLASHFGGQFLIAASLMDDPSVKDTVNLTVRVPGLLAFPNGVNYSLTGNKLGDGLNHPGNHYFHSQAGIDSLISVARQFSKQKWNTEGNLRLNDMSLQYGGAFDIKGKWKKDTDGGGKGHLSHRTGRSVDIENVATETIDTVSIYTGKDTLFTVPKVKFVKQFQDFMEATMGNWKFVDEHQMEPNVFNRTRKFPHFEWRGN